MSSHQSIPNDRVAKKLVTEVALGATRSFWHMRCSRDVRGVTTQAIAPENSLKIPPTLSQLHNNNTHNQPNVTIKTAEVDYDTLTQEMVTSQDWAEEEESKRNMHVRNLDEGGLVDANIELSGEQKAVLHMVLNGRKNIFFTGAAGTGKSVLLRRIISQLRKKYGRSNIGITALTGIAACNIGGQTLHRFAGIGLGKDSVDELLKRVRRNNATKMRWKNTKVLLIDEISMLDCELFEKLEQLARLVRGNDIPFGGIQLICTGDLFQLPPVDKSNFKKFCFETPTWDSTIDKTVNLTRVFRQSDPKFVQILNELRVGNVTPESQTLFASLSRAPKLPKGIVPTQLYSTRREVNSANQSALKRLVGTEFVYECNDWKREGPETKYLDISRDVLAEERVNLKVGAQVMLIKNLDNTLVNGSIGRVVAFMSSNACYEEYGGGEDKLSHYRSRSLPPGAEPQAGGNTDEVAKILGAYGNSASATRKRKFAEHMTTEDSKKSAVLPVVRFVTPQNTVRFLMVQPETWEITDFEGNPIASRTQLPLILAWALSIHKSQGQTLPYVSVDLKNIFENGQAYVAISRATSVDGLQINNFMSKKVKASDKVVTYYEQLERIQDWEIEAAEKHFQEEERKFRKEFELANAAEVSQQSSLQSQSQSQSQSQLSKRDQIRTFLEEEFKDDPEAKAGVLEEFERDFAAEDIRTAAAAAAAAKGAPPKTEEIEFAKYEDDDDDAEYIPESSPPPIEPKHEESIVARPPSRRRQKPSTKKRIVEDELKAPFSYNAAPSNNEIYIDDDFLFSEPDSTSQADHISAMLCDDHFGQRNHMKRSHNVIESSSPLH